MGNTKNLLDPIGGNSIVEKVIKRITDSIITGQLKKGDKIPTEIELSEGLNVGRNTVREAVKVLVYLGVLEIKRPGGTYVTKGYSDKMLNPLLYSLILEDGESKSIVELRNMFEVSISKLAIENASEEDINDIEIKCNTLIKLIDNNETNYEEILKADINFHNSIEQATHNPLISRINSVITRITIPSRLKTTKEIISAGNARFLIESHKKIYEMIRTKDTSKVIEVVDYSYLFWKDNVKD